MKGGRPVRVAACSTGVVYILCAVRAKMVTASVAREPPLPFLRLPASPIVHVSLPATYSITEEPPEELEKL